MTIEPGADERNEAIMLLGMFGAEANGITEAPSQQHHEFIAEAGRMWSRVRPEGGLEKVDRMRERHVYGRALEGWAREYLGVQPLNVAYANDKIRDMYWRMTGRQMQTSDEPVGPTL